MQYNPFDKRLEDLAGPDLGVLRDVSEGWYVEYKSAAIPTKAIAKSISAFANHYGGWLFFCVAESAGKATSFPGIDVASIAELERALRNASADCLHPHVYYEHVVISGPVSELLLPDDRAIIVVRVPPGADTPHVHADGRIYRRVADSSDPKHETDRAILDRLSDRARRARRRLKKLITNVPAVSKGESETPYLHILISSDPLELSSKGFRRDFDWFRRHMRRDPIPFDNFFARADGYVARQTAGNNPRNRVFTWEYFFAGHSRITLPLNAFSGDLSAHFQTYKYAERFILKLEQDGFGPDDAEVLDLNMVFTCLWAVAARHRALMADYKELGPFYVKAYVENVWRRIPYLDTGRYVEFVEGNGVPVIQDENRVVPPGYNATSLLVIERVAPSEIEEHQIADATSVLAWILAALGIPMEVLRDSASEIGYLLERAREAQAHRRGLTRA